MPDARDPARELSELPIDTPRRCPSMTTRPPLRFGLFVARFQPTGQHPTLALEYEPEQPTEKAGS